MKNLEMTELKRLLVDCGRAKSADIVGLTNQEISNVEAALGLSFPASYKDFLQVFGNTASHVFPQEYVSLSLVVSKIDKARRMLSEVAIELPSTAFVFIIGDSQFLFFDTREAPEPAIFSYKEGRSKFERVYDNFNDCINDYLQSEAESTRRSGGYLHGEIISDPAQG